MIKSMLVLKKKKKSLEKHPTGRKNHQIKANCVTLFWAGHECPSAVKKASLAQTIFTGQDILQEKALLFQGVLFSQCLPLAIQDPLFPFSANPHFLKQVLSFSLQLRFPCSLPRNLWARQCLYLWRNVPVQEANAHRSNTDSGPFKWAKTQRRHVLKGLSGLHRQGVKTSVLPSLNFKTFTKVIYVL